MSNSLLAAMAHARPFIVSDIAENTAVIEDAPYNDALGDKGECLLGHIFCQFSKKHLSPCRHQVVKWFMFFLLLAVKKPILKVTGMVTCAEGVLTGWLPGYLWLEGVLG